MRFLTVLILSSALLSIQSVNYKIILDGTKTLTQVEDYDIPDGIINDQNGWTVTGWFKQDEYLVVDGDECYQIVKIYDSNRFFSWYCIKYININYGLAFGIDGNYQTDGNTYYTGLLDGTWVHFRQTVKFNGATIEQKQVHKLYDHWFSGDNFKSYTRTFPVSNYQAPSGQVKLRFGIQKVKVSNQNTSGFKDSKISHVAVLGWALDSDLLFAQPRHWVGSQIARVWTWNSPLQDSSRQNEAFLTDNVGPPQVVNSVAELTSGNHFYLDYGAGVFPSSFTISMYLKLTTGTSGTLLSVNRYTSQWEHFVKVTWTTSPTEPKERLTVSMSGGSFNIDVYGDHEHEHFSLSVAEIDKEQKQIVQGVLSKSTGLYTQFYNGKNINLMQYNGDQKRINFGSDYDGSGNLQEYTISISDISIMEGGLNLQKPTLPTGCVSQLHLERSTDLCMACETGYYRDFHQCVPNASPCPTTLSGSNICQRCQSDSTYMISDTDCYYCGNAVKERYEECDDGNFSDGDGCNKNCLIEEGYDCIVLPDESSLCECAPIPFSSEFIDIPDFTLLEIIFNKEVIYVGAPGCNNMFENGYQSFGTNPTCTINNGNIHIQLDIDHSYNYQQSILLLNTGVITSAGCATPLTAVELREVIVEVEDAEPLFDLTSTAAPDIFDLCDGTIFEIINIGNDFGRPYQITWEIISDPTLSASDQTKVDNFLLPFHNTEILTITPFDLPPIYDEFIFRVTMENFLAFQTVHELTYTQLLFEFQVPTIVQEFYNYANETIQADLTFISNCPESGFTKEWVITSQSELQIENVDYSILNDDRTIITEPYLYIGPRTMTFQVTVGQTEYFAETSKGNTTNAMIRKRNPFIVISQTPPLVFDIREQLTLDASASYDADLPPPQDQDNITTTWSCKYINFQPCFYADGTQITNSNNPVLFFDHRELKPDNIYIFKIDVRSKIDTRRSLQEFQIQMIDGTPPYIQSISVDPIYEGGIINHQQQVVFSPVYDTKSRDTVGFTWTISSLTDENTKLISYGDDKNTTMIIEPDFFKEGTFYIVSVLIADENGEDEHQRQIQTNTAPINGQMEINPKEGIAYKTEFELSTSGWIDVDEPITYIFSIAYTEPKSINDENIFQCFANFTGEQNISLKLPNPEGDEDSQIVYLMVSARDKYQIISRIVEEINLTRYEMEEGEDELEEIYEDMILNSKYDDPHMVVLGAKVVTNMISFRTTSHTASQTEEQVINNLIDDITTTGGSHSSLFMESTKLLEKLTSNFEVTLTEQNIENIKSFYEKQLSDNSTDKDAQDLSKSPLVLQVLSNVIESTNSQFIYPAIFKQDTTVEDYLKLIDDVAVKAGKNLEKGQNITIKAEEVTVQVQKPNNETTSFQFEHQYKSGEKVEVEVPWAKTQFEGQSKDGTSNGAIVVFKAWEKNPYRREQNIQLGFPVVSASFFDNEEEFKVKDLQEPVTLTFEEEKSSRETRSSDEKETYQCVHWDTSQEKWSGLGNQVSMVRENDKKRQIQCKADHLTDFCIKSELSAVLSNSGFQFLDNWDAFEDFSILKVKICFVIILLLLLMILLIWWGRRQDLRNSLIKGRFIAGIKKIADTNSPEKKKNSKLSLTPSNESQIGIDIETPKKQSIQGESSPQDSAQLLNCPEPTKASPPHPITNKRKSRRVKRIKSLKSSMTKQNNYVYEKKNKDKGWSSVLLMSIRLTHNLFSIFLRDDIRLSRSSRFIVYFLRWLGMIATSSLFFKGLNENAYSAIQIIIVSILSFILVTPINLILICFLKNEETRYKNIMKLKFTELEQKQLKTSNCKYRFGLFMAFLYGSFAIVMTLLVGVNSSEEINNDLLISFFIQLGQDIFVNQMIKIFINLFMLMSLTRFRFGLCEKILTKAIDQNLMMAFR